MAALTKAIGRSYVAASTYGSTIYTPTMAFLLKAFYDFLHLVADRVKRVVA